MATTKKLNAVPALSGISAEYIIIADANGKTNRVSLANFKASLLAGANFNDIYDNVFIAHHRRSDGLQLAWRPEEWAAQQSSGEVADGVLIVEGGHLLLVAPTDAGDSGLLWSSEAVSGGGTTTTAQATAQADWAGKANTAAQITKAACQGQSYAPGFCAAYSRSNGNGSGQAAGSWWLPSLAELWMIYANYHKINYALSKITGGVALPAAAHWSSTENSSTYAWYLGFGYGDQITYTKASGRGRVRPVSAW